MLLIRLFHALAALLVSKDGRAVVDGYFDGLVKRSPKRSPKRSERDVIAELDAFGLG